MKTLSRGVLAAIVLALPFSSLRAGEPVKHRFLVVDNAANRLILVDQHDPNVGWSVAIPSPNSRDLQLVGAGLVLVSHPNGAAEYELATGKKVWEITTYNGVHTARRLPSGNNPPVSRQSRPPARAVYAESNLASTAHPVSDWPSA